ncbi:Fimbrial, major and minor subunit [Citrobacter freundii]|nr:Fimbrial, major and minor subunit [Citrobacter freundii]
MPGITNITVPVKTAIPVLGIRPKASNRTFYGGAGISPQINFNNAYNTASISNDTGVLTLDVTDASSNKIGTLRVNMKSGANITEKKSTGGEINSISVFASKAGDAFFGGLATQASGVGAPGLIFDKFPGLKQNVDTMGGSGGCGSSCTATRFTLTSANNQYNGFYAAIIDDGENIQISLTQPSTREAIQWKASLPVTVSYM